MSKQGRVWQRVKAQIYTSTVWNITNSWAWLDYSVNLKGGRHKVEDKAGTGADLAEAHVKCWGACSLFWRPWGTCRDLFIGKIWSDQYLRSSSGARVEWAFLAWRRPGRKNLLDDYYNQLSKRKYESKTRAWPWRSCKEHRTENTGLEDLIPSISDLCQCPTWIVFSIMCIPLSKMRTLDCMVFKSLTFYKDWVS